MRRGLYLLGLGTLIGLTGAPAEGLGAREMTDSLDTIPGSQWTQDDWAVFESKVRWGVTQGLDTAETGAAIARLGKSFVGTTYLPGTLEVPGPERLVINLRELDCVTFVENVLALTRFIRNDGIGALSDPPKARAIYESYLTALRYRGGVLRGYPSRLHYFSDWLAENERAGRIRQIAKSLGGVADSEPLAFMSSHPQSYRQLSDPMVLGEIRQMEDRLNQGPARWYLPEDQIGRAAEGIHDGDIIAATSTLPGLDIAHTGFALWVNGSLHLLHAPLVGKAVEISELPLAQRIKELKTQDGVMVARVTGPEWLRRGASTPAF